jgi:thioredoxin-related protein
MMLIWYIIFNFILVNQTHELNNYSFQEIDELQSLEKRKLVFFLHADWCIYCQNMKNTTLKDPDVVKMLNSNFYFVSFNVEHNQNIQFRNTQFKAASKLSQHALARTICGGKECVLPGFIIINYNDEIEFESYTYLDSKALKKIINNVQIKE